VRVAGIYGPGRSRLLEQVLHNEAAIEGSGERIMNMIHLEDAVGAVIAALERGSAGEIYNAVDDEPVSQMDFYQWLTGVLGREPPPFVPEAPEASPKPTLANRRVSNRRLKADLGYRLKYPTFRQGYTAEIQRAVLAGDLALKPESRLAMEWPRS
jgi:nucleoside-diphosphate-sugar epimerase